jgi:glycosyltransferase involved in cell wall biosynthesis
VIAGKVAGIPEAVEDGISGFLIDPLDEDRLCELLLRLVQDPALREELERSALERVSTEFPLERMAQKTADLIFPEH